MKKKLSKSTINKGISGVCGGIGEYLGVSSSTIRGLFLLSIILTFGCSIMVYASLYLIMPSESKQLKVLY